MQKLYKQLITKGPQYQNSIVGLYCPLVFYLCTGRICFLKEEKILHGSINI